jgi:chaperonin GroES
MATAPVYDEDVAAEDSGASGLHLLAQIAETRDNITDLLDDQTLTTIGSDVVRDYERDMADQQEWREVAERSLCRASQEREELDNPPPYRMSNIDYPILTVAALQFNARAYPAICKPGNMVKVKVIGSDNGRPQTDQQGQPLVQVNGQVMTAQDAQQLVAQAAAQQPPAPANDAQADPNAPPAPQGPPPPQPEPLWQIAPGSKQLRADRVSDYMNVYLQYRMDGWEEDTDQLLFEVPIVGSGFRKLWWEDGKQCAAYVSALDLIVPVKTKTLEECPRITERLNDVFPFEIRKRINKGDYRKVLLPSGTEDEEQPRLLLEAHRYLDLDGDGVDEPYIVTVDHETTQVLRIAPNFDADDVHLTKDGQGVAWIDKGRYYIKYPFLPHPKGIFYGLGFGHLTEQLGDTVNSSLNQMFDAGHAQIAGGGFIAGGLRLQNSNRDDTIRWMPGEYKTVSVAGGDLRAGIVDRTFPAPSPVMFQLMEMMLAAAKDITGVKDILTGDVPNTAPVGTTLAIVEQAQTVFTSIYKRLYRAAGDEFALIYDNLSRYGGQTVAEDYLNVLDDLAADFAKDFGEDDVDIKPTADPASVTNMQKIAKAQFLFGMTGRGLNDMEIYKRVFEAADIENIPELLPQGEQQPDPLTMSKIQQAISTSHLNDARAAEAAAKATKVGVDVGMTLGSAGGQPQASVNGTQSGL